MKLRGANNTGFSLVELVTIMVVVGILAAFAVPRLVGRTGFESRGVFDQAQGIVRYAQKIAIAQRQSPPAKQPIFVIIGANQIQVCYDTASPCNPVADPSTGAALVVNVPPGVNLDPPTTFSFNGSGTPSFGARLQIGVNSTPPDINRAFFVEAQTGYVHP